LREGVIDGRLGFCHCFADEYELESITRDLGTEYAFLQIYFKPYCSCRYVHFAIEAALNILNEKPLDWKDVKEVKIRTHKNGKQCSDIPEFQTPLHARLSIQYGIASILVRGTAGLMDYTEEKIRDERVCALARKMTLEVDPEIQKVYPNPRSMVVEITDKAGDVWSSRVDYAKGDPKNPISDIELKAKFTDITQKVIDSELREKIMDEAMKAEKWENADHFMSMLQLSD
jgi:2-methylcitrate dehydratase PrpD